MHKGKHHPWATQSYFLNAPPRYTSSQAITAGGAQSESSHRIETLFWGIPFKQDSYSWLPFCTCFLRPISINYKFLRSGTFCGINHIDSLIATLPRQCCSLHMTHWTGEDWKPKPGQPALVSGSQPPCLLPQQAVQYFFFKWFRVYTSYGSWANCFMLTGWNWLLPQAGVSVCCATGNQKVEAFPREGGLASYQFISAIPSTYVSRDTKS